MILDNMCYAEFLAYYVLDIKPIFENDCQPEILNDDMDGPKIYPKYVPLMSSKEKMKCRTIKKVLRYHTPNPVSHSEDYAHHLLMLFYPFRKESDLLSLNSKTYIEKLNETNATTIVNKNKCKFEPCGNILDVLMNYIF